jgi:hypothetical protein
MSPTTQHVPEAGDPGDNRSAGPRRIEAPEADFGVDGWAVSGRSSLCEDWRPVDPGSNGAANAGPAELDADFASWLA